MPTVTMRLRFRDGRVETFEFEPMESPARDVVTDSRLQIGHAWKEGLLRMHVDDSELTVFAGSLASIEHSPAPPAPPVPTTVPVTFRRAPCRAPGEAGDRPPGTRACTLTLHYLGGCAETLEFDVPETLPAGAAAEDLKLQLSRTMKEGVLRLRLEDSELTVFTAALAYLETCPAVGGPSTFPSSFHRVPSD